MGILPDGGRTMIKTTYMMTKEVLMLLKEAEKRTGWTMIDLVIAVMRSAMRHHAKYEQEYGRIAYQKRLDDEGMPIPKLRVKIKFLQREGITMLPAAIYAACNYPDVQIALRDNEIGYYTNDMAFS